MTSDALRESLFLPDPHLRHGARCRPRLRLIAHAAGTVKAHVDREEVVSGRINAVLDVTNPEPLPDDDLLLTLPNVTVTPHIAGSVGNELPAMAELAASEVERLAAGVPCWLPGQPR